MGTNTTNDAEMLDVQNVRNNEELNVVNLRRSGRAVKRTAPIIEAEEDKREKERRIDIEADQ